MESESPYEDSLCYIYIGQRTGKYGLLKEDFENYQKNSFQRVNTFSTMKNLGLIKERTLPGVRIGKMPAYDKIFLQTTKQGEQEARKILKRRIEAANELQKRLETIPENTLIFLIKHELLNLDGVYPVDTKDPPQMYIKDKLDIQRDQFNCLLDRFEIEWLNNELLRKREELFWALIEAELCVTSSAYWLTGIIPKYVCIDMAPQGPYENKRNYCVPPEVLAFINSMFLAKTEKFEFTAELRQKHFAYHQIRESKTHLRNLSSDEAGSWLEGPMESNVISPIDDSVTIRVLNNMLARKTLSLSTLERLDDGKKWRTVNTADLYSKEAFRFLEEQCLKPILDFLATQANSTSLKTESDSEENPLDVIIDASNVAFDDVPQGQPARYGNIVLCSEYYKKKDMRIKIVADANLRHKIDEKAAFQKALDEKLVYQSPPGREADEYILKLAFRNPGSKIVSNDNFLDWAQKFSVAPKFFNAVFAKPERFVKFKVNGAFIEFPFRQ